MEGEQQIEMKTLFYVVPLSPSSLNRERKEGKDGRDKEDNYDSLCGGREREREREEKDAFGPKRNDFWTVRSAFNPQIRNGAAIIDFYHHSMRICMDEEEARLLLTQEWPKLGAESEISLLLLFCILHTQDGFLVRVQ